jgi:DMSO/TMAO reductase YedYZ heme-binding membrane subunit
MQEKIMKLKSRLEILEKRKIISRRPHPFIPFILVIIIYGIAEYARTINKTLSIFAYILALFCLVFAVIHNIIYKILTGKR